MTATFSTLKNGEWGVRVLGPAPKPGSTVTVTTRTGDRRSVVIDRVIWSGGGTHLCTLRPQTGHVSTSSGRGPSGGGCGGYCPVGGHRCTAAHPCHDCL